MFGNWWFALLVYVLPLFLPQVKFLTLAAFLFAFVEVIGHLIVFNISMKSFYNSCLFTAAFSIFWVCICFSMPPIFLRLFMHPTDANLAIAPRIIRVYSLSFLLLPFNIFSTYYFQAMMKPKISMIISVARGLVISSFLIIILPLINKKLLFDTMVTTEIVVMIYAMIMIKRSLKALTTKWPVIS